MKRARVFINRLDGCEIIKNINNCQAKVESAVYLLAAQPKTLF